MSFTNIQVESKFRAEQIARFCLFTIAHMLRMQIMNFSKLFIKSVLVVVISVVVFGSQSAKAEFPEKPIQMMVGFGAGGGTDVYARNLAGLIHDHMTMPMLVVNKPGAAGMIAAKTMNDAEADGHMVLTAGGGNFIIKAVTDGDKAKVSPLKTFQPLGGLGQLVTSVVVHRDSPFKSAKDLVEYGKKNPGKLRWSHSGRGSFHTMGGMLFLKQNGVKAQDVPFKGGAKARQAVVSKQVDFAFIGIQQTAGFEDHLRAIGVTSGSRDPLYMDVPTFGEQGLVQMSVAQPIIVWARNDIPEEATIKLTKAIEEIATSETFMGTLRKAGLIGSYFTPEEAVKRMSELDDILTPVVREVFNK